MNRKCGRCGKPIEREESVRAGLGPVCRKILAKSTPKEFKCHHGFACLPSVEYHIPTFLNRARRKYSVYGIPWEDELERAIIDALGIERERIKIDIKDKTERLKIEHLKKHGELSYRDEVLLTKEAYRRRKVCPYGLDCQEPEKALDAVYALIARAIDHMEDDPDLPLVEAIEDLLDVLQVLGFNERQHYKKLEGELKKTARKKAARKYADKFVEELLGEF